MLALFQVKFDNAQEQIYNAISSYIHLDSLAQVFVINTEQKFVQARAVLKSCNYTYTKRRPLATHIKQPFTATTDIALPSKGRGNRKAQRDYGCLNLPSGLACKAHFETAR